MKHLTVSVVKTAVEEFEKDHCRENVGKFVLTAPVNNNDDDESSNYDLHCMYASEWADGKIQCINSWGPTNDPRPNVEKGKILLIFKGLDLTKQFQAV